MKNEITALITILLSITFFGLSTTLVIIWLIALRTSYKIILTCLVSAIIIFHLVSVIKSLSKTDKG